MKPSKKEIRSFLWIADLVYLVRSQKLLIACNAHKVSFSLRLAFLAYTSR